MVNGLHLYNTFYLSWHLKCFYTSLLPHRSHRHSHTGGRAATSCPRALRHDRSIAARPIFLIAFNVKIGCMLSQSVIAGRINQEV